MFKMRVVTFYLLINLFFICVISTEAVAKNSSNTVGKVISTRSKEQRRSENNLNTSTVFVSTPVDITNSSDTLGKAILTKSKKETEIDINLNKTLLILPNVEAENVSDTVTVKEMWCKEELVTNNDLNRTTILPCVNLTQTNNNLNSTTNKPSLLLQNKGNHKKNVHDETKLIDPALLENDRHIFDGPVKTPEPCPSSDEVRLPSGVCTVPI